MILLSVGIFILLFTPLLLTYLTSPELTVSSSPSEEFRIAIPRINAYAPVIQNVDPWNENEYNAALKRGVAHAASTGLPGEGKTTYLFAHSTGFPWEQLYYNTIFLRLGELKPGDEIILDRNKKRFTYRVVRTIEVWPDDTEYLRNIERNQLILQTCTPIGTTLKRLLVFAEPVE